MLNLRDINSATPLHVAVEGGSIEVIKYLIDEEGADVNAISSSVGTVLNSLWFIHGGHSKKAEILQLLTDRGVDLQRDYYCPLAEFFRANQNDTKDTSDLLDLLSILIKHGALVTSDHLPLAFLWASADFNTQSGVNS